MAYPYGTQGAPAVGTGAPGLPQRSSGLGADPAGPPLQAVVVRPNGIYASTPYIIPDWVSYARITALGKGGQGLGGTSGPAQGTTGYHGGGGAGLAGTNIEATPPGTPVIINFSSSATLVSFLSYQLAAGNGGDATAAAGGSGGVGSGGAVNFSGGAGGTGASSGSGLGGGGAAGRGGNGTAGANQQAGNSGLGDTYTTGGGAGGAPSDTIVRIGGVSRSDTCAPGAVAIGTSTLTANNTNSANCNGGDGGGGSGGSALAGASNVPGLGLVLIELW